MKLWPWALAGVVLGLCLIITAALFLADFSGCGVPEQAHKMECEFR